MLLVFQHSDSGTLGTMRPLLDEYALPVRMIRIQRNDPMPEDLDDVEGIIALGGPQSANDSNPALEREMGLLRAAHATGLPILGICLGAQLLAKALGGEVTRMHKPEIGWLEVTLNELGREDPLFAGIGWTTRQFHWHTEQVTTLPKGGRVLAKSAACPIQAWGVGLRTYALQYHPEVDETTIRRWLREDAHQLGPAETTADDVLRATMEQLPTMMRLTERLVANWALCVAPGERGVRGPGPNRASVGV